MKNATITKPLRFLEDRIALILGLFFPAWFGILYLSGFLLAVILRMLPKETADMLTPHPMHVLFVILGSLVVCALIAICRIIRDIRERKPKQIPVYLFLLVMDVLIVWYFSHIFGEVS